MAGIKIHSSTQKGDIKSIEDFGPIVNPCSIFKIFEKLILKRILEIQDDNQCDLTGQNGFKKNCSNTVFTSPINNCKST
jgi:hypothetical protein